jgi:hypothetical protein
VAFAVDKVALGQFFSECFGFPCQSFHQFLHHHNRPGLAQLWSLVAAVPSAPNWTLYQLKKLQSGKESMGYFSKCVSLGFCVPLCHYPSYVGLPRNKRTVTKLIAVQIPHSTIKNCFALSFAKNVSNKNNIKMKTDTFWNISAV